MSQKSGCYLIPPRRMPTLSPVEQSKKRRVGAPGLQNFRGNRNVCRPGALTGRLFRQAAGGNRQDAAIRSTLSPGERSPAGNGATPHSNHPSQHSAQSPLASAFRPPSKPPAIIFEPIGMKPGSTNMIKQSAVQPQDRSRGRMIVANCAHVALLRETTNPEGRQKLAVGRA
jgi:hypothetical protein